MKNARPGLSRQDLHFGESGAALQEHGQIVLVIPIPVLGLGEVALQEFYGEFVAFLQGV